MPIEERRIKFNYNEFKPILAFNLSSVRDAGFDGNISKIEAFSFDMVNGISNKRPSRDHEIPALFTITSHDAAGKISTLDLDHEFILNSLIEHCLNNQIILARDFTKKAHAAAGWIWLELSTPIEDKNPFGITGNSLVFDE